MEPEENYQTIKDSAASPLDPSPSNSPRLSQEITDELLPPLIDSKPTKIRGSQIQIDNLNKQAKEVLRRVSASSHKFDQYKIPPSFAKCKQYWKATKLGALNPLQTTKTDTNSTEEQLEDPTQSKKNQIFKVGEQKVKLTLGKNPFNLKGAGISIPIYYLYILCCLILTVLAFASFFLPGVEYRNRYCQWMRETNGGRSCSIFDLASYQVLYYQVKFDDRAEKEFLEFLVNHRWVQLICLFITYATVIFFYRLQANIRLDYYLNRTETSISEFTVMVDQVDVSEPIEDIYRFICETMEQCEYSKPTIKAVSVVRADGILKLTGKQIVENRVLYQVIQDKKESLQVDEEDLANHGRKAYENILKGLDKENKKLEDKLENLNKNRPQLEYRNKSSSMFISFNSNYEKEQLIDAFKTVYPTSDNLGGYLLCCFCFRKKPKYKISEAPEPENINWTNIGFTDRERSCKRGFSRSLLFLLAPSAVIIFMLLKIIQALVKFSNYSSIFWKVVFSLLNYAIIAVFKKITDLVITFLQGYERSLKKTDYLARKAFLVGLLQFGYIFAGNYAYAFVQAESSSRESPLSKYILDNIYAGEKILSYALTTVYVLPLMTYFNFRHLKSAFFRWRISELFKKNKIGPNEGGERIEGSEDTEGT